MGKKKAEKKSAPEAGAKTGDGFGVTVLQPDRVKYVILDFKLLTWKYMNFTKKFDENTRIFTVKKLLAERHGRMTDLKLCLGSFTESNEIEDEMRTLAEYGMTGKAESDLPEEGDDEGLPMYQIFYDFKPTDFDDPVLLFFEGKMR